jgi:hypothetical protein
VIVNSVLQLTPNWEESSLDTLTKKHETVVPVSDGIQKYLANASP